MKLGFDAAINYESDNLAEQLKVAAPNEVDTNLKSLRVQGFIVTDYVQYSEEVMSTLGRYVAEGKIKFKSRLIEGFDRLPEGLMMLFYR